MTLMVPKLIASRCRTAGIDLRPLSRSGSPKALSDTVRHLGKQFAWNSSWTKISLLIQPGGFIDLDWRLNNLHFVTCAGCEALSILFPGSSHILLRLIPVCLWKT